MGRKVTPAGEQTAAGRIAALRAARDRYLLLDRKAKQSPRERTAYRLATAELNRLVDERRRQRWAGLAPCAGE